MNLPIMSVIILAFITAYVLVIRFRPGYLLPLIVVSGIGVLFMGLIWLSFGYRSFGIPVRALLFPDRAHHGLNASIPLPPHSVLTGRCSATGGWYYSRNTLDAIDQFYRSLPSAEPGALTSSKLAFRYGTAVIGAVQRSPGVSELTIDCPVQSTAPATNNP